MKYAHLIREKTGATVYEFYIDIRSPGKGYEEFYNRVQSEGVQFIRGNVAGVTDKAIGEDEKGKLIVLAEDSLSGRFLRVPVDAVILSVGLEAAEGADAVARMVGISQDQDGWFNELHPKLAPQATPSDGVFLAGCCQGPKDIPDTISQAKAAAASALIPLLRGVVPVESATAVVDTEMCAGCGMCVEVCPFGAPALDPDWGVSRINAVLCKGCGACAVTCPSKAIQLQHFLHAQVMAQVDALLG